MFNINTKNVEAIDIKPFNLANGLLKVNFLDKQIKKHPLHKIRLKLIVVTIQNPV